MILKRRGRDKSRRRHGNNVDPKQIWLLSSMFTVGFSCLNKNNTQKKMSFLLVTMAHTHTHTHTIAIELIFTWVQQLHCEACNIHHGPFDGSAVPRSATYSFNYCTRLYQMSSMRPNQRLESSFAASIKAQLCTVYLSLSLPIFLVEKWSAAAQSIESRPLPKSSFLFSMRPCNNWQWRAFFSFFFFLVCQPIGSRELRATCHRERIRTRTGWW